MSDKNYICVFKADPNVQNDVADVGNDPDFSDTQPTWGICRPQVRTNWLEIGSRILFIGHFPDHRYFIKGWFSVGEKLNYIEALDKFPKRANVIIRHISDGLREREYQWKYCHNRSPVPEFLKEIKYENKIFIQNPNDNHEIDNWKCRRIFLCRKDQLRKCLDSLSCLHESEFTGKRGYIVAKENEWTDYGKKGIKAECLFPKLEIEGKKIRTPHGQHNVIKMPLEQFEKLTMKLDEHHGS